jgi:hypothetical protein
MKSKFCKSKVGEVASAPPIDLTDPAHVLVKRGDI